MISPEARKSGLQIPPRTSWELIVELHACRSAETRLVLRDAAGTERLRLRSNRSLTLKCMPVAMLFADCQGLVIAPADRGSGFVLCRLRDGERL